MLGLGKGKAKGEAKVKAPKEPKAPKAKKSKGGGFQLGKIKQFAVGHGEKIIFGVFVLICLLLVYGGYFGQTRYDKVPNDFQTQMNQVSNAVSNAQLGEVPIPPAPPAGELPKVDPVLYAVRPLAQPVFETGHPRAEPAFLAVRELRVATGYGPVACIPKEQPGDIAAAAPGVEEGPAAPGAAPPPEREGPEGGGMRIGPGLARDRRQEGGGGMKMGGMGAGQARGGGGLARGRPAGGGLGMNAAGVDEAPGVAQFDRPTNSEAHGKQWTVITGIVPLREQAKLYREAFRNSLAYDAARDDVPTWYTSVVERAEVVSGDTAEPGNWQRVDPNAIIAEEAEWAAEYPEPAALECVDEQLTRPIPPASGIDFGNSVIHPKIPRAEDVAEAAEQPVEAAAPGQAEAVPGVEQPRDTQAAASPPPPAASAPPSQFGRGGAQPAAPAAQRGGLAGGMRMGGMGGGLGARRPGLQPGGAARGGLAAGAVGVPQAVVTQELPEFLLFRFFDFTVEPGKTYRYRVRLLVNNPNFGVEAKYLQDPASANSEIKESAWSDASPAISIPRGGSLLAGEAQPGTGARETSAKVIAQMWDAKRAVRMAREFTVYRGQVADFMKTKMLIDDPESPGVPKEDVVDLRTEMLLVDITGGGGRTGSDLSRQATSPTELLVMTPDGKFRVMSQLADADAYKREQTTIGLLEEAHKPPPDPDKDKEAEGDTQGGMSLKAVRPPKKQAGGGLGGKKGGS